MLLFDKTEHEQRTIGQCKASNGYNIFQFKKALILTLF